MAKYLHRHLIEDTAWRLVDTVTATESLSNPKISWGTGQVGKMVHQIYNRGALPMDEDLCLLANQVVETEP